MPTNVAFLLELMTGPFPTHRVSARTLAHVLTRPPTQNLEQIGGPMKRAEGERARAWCGETIAASPSTALCWRQSNVTSNDTGYTTGVAIVGFRHRGLERFFVSGSKSGVQAKHADRLRLLLGRLNVATSPRDMKLPGLAMHQLKGTRRGTWAVKVSGNWRLTFGFQGPDVDRVDYEDYH